MGAGGRRSRRAAHRELPGSHPSRGTPRHPRPGRRPGGARGRGRVLPGRSRRDGLAGDRRASIRRREPRRRGGHRGGGPATPAGQAREKSRRAVISHVYARLLEARARRYASRKAVTHRLEHPVISVGNITMGGTGKTPFVAHLARRLKFEGKRPAILSRGYGRTSRGVVLVSEGNGPLVTPDAGGDE